jgi:hypothetical protein
VRRIAVSPIGLAGLLDPRMLRVMGTELAWIWAPSLIIGAALSARRRRVHSR